MSRDDLVRFARALHQRGWVANHDGNATARSGPGRFLSTPTATSKADIDQRSLLIVDADGKRVSGRGRPFGELALHLEIYRQRQDVNAVLHAHPPHATALACSGSSLLEQPFIAEAVVSIGPRVPTVPFALPADAAAALAPFAADYDAVLLANHGVISWGASVEQAFLRMELVEHLARVALAAEPSGGVQPLPALALPPLLAARARAGLGSAADRATELPSVAATLAPARQPTAPTSSSRHGDELSDIIRQEIVQLLQEDS